MILLNSNMIHVISVKYGLFFDFPTLHYPFIELHDIIDSRNHAAAAWDLQMNYENWRELFKKKKKVEKSEKG